jgi:selenocysteine lyase/cysteine desulfurase
LPNIAALDADIYLFSTYKTYGPHQGAMVVRRNLVDQLPNQGHEFNGGDPTKRLTPAGPDHAQIAACAGIADYFDDLAKFHGFDGLRASEKGERVHALFRQREQQLLQPLLDYFSSRNDVRLLGPADAEGRAPTVSVVLKEPGETVAARLNSEGIMAGDGDFYAGRVIRAMGEDPNRGILRLSFVHYTSEAEIEQLLSALDRQL